MEWSGGGGVAEERRGERMMRRGGLEERKDKKLREDGGGWKIKTMKEMRDKKGGKDSSKVSEPGYVCELESKKEERKKVEWRKKSLCLWAHIWPLKWGHKQKNK